MKAIVKLYLNYLELILIGMLVAALAITLVAGLLAGGIALLPALLANTTIIAIGLITLGRRKALGEHPEIKTKPFKEFRLFMLVRKSKIILVAVLVLVTLGTTYSTNRLLMNQAIASSGMGVSATFFNNALIINVLEISPGDKGNPYQVTAVLYSNGYPVANIENQSVGYETTYIGRDRFIVRIVEVTNIYAKFFVERIADGKD